MYIVRDTRDNTIFGEYNTVEHFVDTRKELTDRVDSGKASNITTFKNAVQEWTKNGFEVYEKVPLEGRSGDMGITISLPLPQRVLDEMDKSPSDNFKYRLRIQQWKRNLVELVEREYNRFINNEH